VHSYVLGNSLIITKIEKKALRFLSPVTPQVGNYIGLLVSHRTALPTAILFTCVMHFMVITKELFRLFCGPYRF